MTNLDIIKQRSYETIPAGGVVGRVAAHGERASAAGMEVTGGESKLAQQEKSGYKNHHHKVMWRDEKIWLVRSEEEKMKREH